QCSLGVVPATTLMDADKHIVAADGIDEVHHGRHPRFAQYPLAVPMHARNEYLLASQRSWLEVKLSYQCQFDSQSFNQAPYYGDESNGYSEPPKPPCDAHAWSHGEIRLEEDS